MPTIGIIDDREDMRKTLRRGMKTVLESDWNTVDSSPLPQLHDYLSWIGTNKIVSLIVDEKLNEIALDSSGAVGYYGHELVDFLRSRLKTFPIFVVTSYPDEPSLEDRFKDVEAIIDRMDFLKKLENYVPRMTRASQQYLQVFEHELSELSKISTKIATGEAISVGEEQLARAIQSKIELAFSIDDLSNRNEWLLKMDETLDELEKLKNEVEQILKLESGEN